MLQRLPLNQQVYRPGQPLSLARGSTSLSRPGHYKLWTEERMEKALDAVVSKHASIRRAALDYGVPKSTLGDRVSGRVLPGSVSGPSTYLTAEEEEELVTFLRRGASIGYAKSRQEVMSLVQRILHSKGIDRHVSNGWWESFCQRHPNLTLRAPVPLSEARAVATDPEMLDSYFDLLETTLTENDLLDKPCQIFNVDETGLPLDAKSPKLVFERGERNPAAIGSGNKAQITVIGCVSAGGVCLPPMVIWDRKTLSPELTVGEVPGTIYGLSDKGWVDQELFDIWFSNHFLRYAPPLRPLLLLLDGHSSHYFPETIHKAAKEQVVIFVLPPNTTHLTQPLDKGCFGPLKVKWREVCHQYTISNPGKVVNRYVFSQPLNQAWMQAMTMTNIVAGFQVTGVYPLSRQVLQPMQHRESVTEMSGLAFIPLCSPAH